MINISIATTEDISGKAASEVDATVYGCVERMVRDLSSVYAADILSITFSSDVSGDTDTFHPKDFR